MAANPIGDPAAGEPDPITEAVARVISETERAHLAQLVQRAVEQETVELTTHALAQLDTVPPFLRGPLLRLLAP